MVYEARHIYLNKIKMNKCLLFLNMKHLILKLNKYNGEIDESYNKTNNGDNFNVGSKLRMIFLK